MTLKTNQNSVGFYTVILLVFASVIGVSADACADKANGLKYQDRLDCHGFFVCIKNTSYQAYCDYGEKFDADSQKCVIGKCPPCDNCDAQCGTSTPADSTTTPVSIPTGPWDPNSCRGHPDGSIYRDPYDCTKFYFCVGGRESAAYCTGNTYFDTNLHACYDADKVECTPTSETTTPPPVDPNSCDGHPSGSIYRDPNDCGKFYYCINGIQNAFSCPNGEYFDTNLNVCRDAKDVYCPTDITSSSSTSSTTTTTTTEAPTTTSSTTTTTTEAPTTTSSTTTTTTEAPTTTSSTTTTTTEAPTTTSSTTTTTTEAPTTTSSTTTTTTEAPTTTSSTTTTTTEAPTTTSSTTTTTTEAPTTTSTTTISTPTTTISTSSTTPKNGQVDPNVKDCFGMPNGSFVRNTEHCQIYYVCRDGSAVKHSCPVKQWFDDINFVCNLRESVQCAAGID